jgi:hypothetical protein
MSAQIAETTFYEVRCPECGGQPAQYITRSAAEEHANDHDTQWHAPVFDDELVQL